MHFINLKYIKIAFLLFLVFSAVCMSFFSTHDYFFNVIHIGNFSGSSSNQNYILYTDGCKVPWLDPYDSTVIKYIENTTGSIPCDGSKYISLINNEITLDSVQVEKHFGNKSFTCTYKAIYRNPENLTLRADNKISYGNESALNFNSPMPDEFIKIFCTVEGKVVYEEFLASTPIKDSVEERCKKNKIEMTNPLNVILVGIDSISKLNFERHFRLTSEYLRKKISAFEFNGYMKVADNTFPNLTPLLTGHFIDMYYNSSNSERYFDDLPFIWKRFSSIGYRTFLAEDAPVMATYNYAKNGFQYPPTDYFFRPFTLAIEDTPWFDASRSNCFQATPEIQVLFNYLKNFLEIMGDRPYFAFTWAARLTHADVNKAGYADKPAYELLQTIHDMDLLNRSMLIFMSDHGIRFGDIRKTYIGKIEERMPFLFVTFPNWFLKSYPHIQKNLISNQQKLVTPFDLHETLVDLYQMTSNDYDYIRTPYGISLFQEIPSNRNCKSAFILPHWCVCHTYKTLRTTDKMAVDAAKSIVAEINRITQGYREYCEELELNVILDARVSEPGDDLLRYEELDISGEENSVVLGSRVESYEKLMINIKTLPGGGEFESTIRKVTDNYKVYDISRINIYGKQGDCVQESNIRKYCYCKTNQTPISHVSV